MASPSYECFKHEIVDVITNEVFNAILENEVVMEESETSSDQDSSLAQEESKEESMFGLLLPISETNDDLNSNISTISTDNGNLTQDEETEVKAGQGDAEFIPNQTVINDDWKTRECDLLKKIEELEKLNVQSNVNQLQEQLKVRDDEIEALKLKVVNLETQLVKSGGGNNKEVIDKLKQQHEELLSRARGMLFDKTKVVKHQELQIEALSTQVASLKDVADITKDLLEIRNTEIKNLESRLELMETRFKSERDRHAMQMKRTEESNNIVGTLKNEYDTQLNLFKELRVRYDDRVKALVAENTLLNERLGRTPNPTLTDDITEQ